MEFQASFNLSENPKLNHGCKYKSGFHTFCIPTHDHGNREIVFLTNRQDNTRAIVQLNLHHPVCIRMLAKSFVAFVGIFLGHLF